MRKAMIVFTMLVSSAAFAQDEDVGTAPKVQPPEVKRPQVPGEPCPETEATQNINKQLGIGGGGTLSGLTGAEMEIYLTDLMIDLHFGLNFFTQEPKAALQLAAGIFYRMRIFDNVVFMPGARFAFGFRSTGGYVPGEVLGESSLQIAFEFPARVEIYFADILSVHAEVGPMFTYIAQGTGVLGESWATVGKGAFLSAAVTDLLGTVGFTVYLK